MIPQVRRRRAQRHTRLVRLGYRDYEDYLRSSAWRRVRSRYWESDQPRDCICGETEALQLHHLTYERVGEERLGDLTPLCDSCHKMIHELERQGLMGLGFEGFINERRAERNRLVEDRRMAAIKRQRQEEEERIETLRAALPIDVRLAAVQRAALRKGISIASPLRVIERQLWRIEQRLERARREPQLATDR